MLHLLFKWILFKIALGPFPPGKRHIAILAYISIQLLLQVEPTHTHTTDIHVSAGNKWRQRKIYIEEEEEEE